MQFPVPYSEFNGDESACGIWFQQEGECIDGMQVHDYYNSDLTGDIYHFSTLKVFEDLLNANGWHPHGIPVTVDILHHP